MTHELLTAAELAERLKIKESTVKQWHRRGVIPAIRLSPKVIRFSLEDVIIALQTPSNAEEVPDAR